MTNRSVAASVLANAGRTLAKEAKIRLSDQPAPLWQLLVLANLISARIAADIALAAARELNAAGATTPQGMLALTWQQRVDALGRGSYVRYDESTATRLGECAQHAADTYGGDLRRLAQLAEYKRSRLVRGLQEFQGIGPTGAHIFCREAQAAWPWLRPYFDQLALKGADRAGLPTDADSLAELVDEDDLAAFAAGLVHVARDNDLAEQVAGDPHAGSTRPSRRDG